MTENFLHHVWKYKLFDQSNLRTTQGLELQIKSCGTHNHDSGPDFGGAKIFIDGTQWAGNVELHLHTSQWNQHGHQFDDAYKNVILHVVFEHDKPTHDNIPVLELKNYIAASLLSNYEHMMHNNTGIPCCKHGEHMEQYTATAWLERMLIERLEDKSMAIEQSLAHNNHNWEKTFYHLLARNFGFKTNAIPFELLARNTSMEWLAKHKDQLLQIEALLFGNAGLLPQRPVSDYEKELVREYQMLKQKFACEQVNTSLWKFLRMRPTNFPTLRIAQFASLVHQSSHLLSKVLEIKKMKDIHSLLNVHASTYWDTHYHFGKESEEHQKKLGIESIENITINTIIPILFYYGKLKDNSSQTKLALRLFDEIAGEQNTVTKKFAFMKVPLHTASQSQAYIQLYNNYCLHKKCLQCAIGLQLLKK